MDQSQDNQQVEWMQMKIKHLLIESNKHNIKYKIYLDFSYTLSTDSPMMTSQQNSVSTVCEQVLQAWNTILNPQSSNTLRQSAESFLTEFKQSSSYVQQVAFHSLQPSFQQNACMLGLHLLQDLIQHKWESLSTEQHLLFRQQLFTIIQQRCSCNIPLQDTFAKLIVCIALNSWPTEWNDFLSISWLTLTSNSSTLTMIGLPIEFVLDIQRILAEELFSVQKKTELKSLLVQLCPSFIAPWKSILLSHIFSISEQLQVSMFKLLTVYIEWIPFSSISDDLLLDRDSFYSLSPKLTQNATCYYLDVLYTLIHRPGRHEEQISLLEPLVTFVFPWFLESLCHITPKVLTTVDLHRSIFDRIVQILCDFGEKHITKFKISRLDSYLECMTLLTFTSDEHVLSMALSFWAYALKHCDSLPNDKLSSLIQIIGDKRLLCQSERDKTLNDFDIIRIRTCEIIQGLTKQKPLEMTQWIKNMIISNHSTEGEYIIFIFLESLLSSLNNENDNVVLILHQILEYLLSRITKSYIMDGIGHICLVLDEKLISLHPVLNICIPLITNQDEDIRKSVTNWLVRAGLILKSKFLPYYQTLFEQIRSILFSNTVGWTEKASLIEFLLIISSYNEEDFTCRFICEPILNEWHSVAKIDSINGFMSIFGFDSLCQLNPVYNDKEQDKRSWMQYLCHVTHIIIKRLSSISDNTNEYSKIWNIIVNVAVPICTRLVQYIHQIWNIDTWKQVYPNAKTLSTMITTMTEEEKKNFLGMGAFERNVEYQSTLDKITVQLRIWLGHLRMTLYALFGELFRCKNKIMIYESFKTNNAWLGIFTDVIHMQERHMKPFIHLLLQYLILECPEKYYDSVFMSPWFRAFFQFMTQRLDGEWECVSEYGIEDDKLLDEMVHERSLRSETHAFVHLLHDLLIPLTERGAKVGTLEQSNNEILKYILITHRNELAEPILNSVLHCFMRKDSISCDKAIQISQRLVMLLGGRSEYMTLVGHNLVLACMKTLSDGYHQEVHEHVLSLLSLIYSFNSMEMEATIHNCIPSTSLTALQSAKDTKKRKAILKEILKPITGVKMSCLYRLNDDGSTINRWKNTLASKRSKSFDLLDYDDTPLGLSSFLNDDA